MSSTIKIAAGLVALAVIAGCSNPEPDEIVIVEPAPIMAEPVSTKY